MSKQSSIHKLTRDNLIMSRRGLIPDTIIINNNQKLVSLQGNRIVDAIKYSNLQ